MSKLIYDSTKNSDMFYATGVNIVDPFFFIDTEKEQLVFLDHREFDLFKEYRSNKNVKAVLLNDIIKKACKLKDNTSLINKLAIYLLKKYKIAHKKIIVPANFPFSMALFLQSKGIKLIPKISFWPERIKKINKEVDYIRKNSQSVINAFKYIETVLKESEIKGDKLKYRGKILTSEFLKLKVEHMLIEKDMLSAEGIIISCGRDSSIPHHPGKGLLKPFQTIVCDIFPKNKSNSYFTDMTRTYIKG
ncbi:MAG: M24 family metallopeptidase, partial [Patescibacteria group bacterium]